MSLLKSVIAVAACVLPMLAGAEEIGQVSTVFKFLGPNDRIVVEAFDDPKVEGVTCYLSRAKTGGVKGGFVYGATDEFGYYAVEDRMHIHDLHATMLHLLGLNHEALTYPYGGRAFRLTDVAGVVAKKILA